MLADRIERRAMFALEFIDPVTRLVVADGLMPSVAGLPPPLRGRSGRFVWRDLDPAAERDIKVDLIVRNPMFGKPAAPLEYTIPANDGHIQSALLLRRAVLTTTARYVPPDGITGAVGMLVEDEATKAPVEGVRLALAFRHAGNQIFASAREAVSEADGAFAAVANDLGDVKPDPAPPDSPGNVLAWLALTRPGSPPQARFTDFLPLRSGRLTQLREPLRWADLRAAPPEPNDA